jgi:hypothetical protein
MLQCEDGTNFYSRMFLCSLIRHLPVLKSSINLNWLCFPQFCVNIKRIPTPEKMHRHENHAKLWGGGYTRGRTFKWQKIVQNFKILIQASYEAEMKNKDTVALGAIVIRCGAA